MPVDSLTFPVVTFTRVFDTEPAPELLDLPALIAGLRRFECKPELQAGIDRETTRIFRIRDEIAAGRAVDGPLGAALARARSEGKLEAEARKLADDARRDAKKALRLWSPVVYAPGARRGSESVLALSCLVLDYDHGATLEDAAFTWEPWFHLIHSTWSHREEDPRFRVVLPLARLVSPLDWPAVWKWASAMAEDRVDAALKGVGVTYALPVTPGPDAPRLFRVNGGAFLDPADEGVVLRPCDVPMPTPVPGPSRFARQDVVKHSFVEG